MTTSKSSSQIYNFTATILCLLYCYFFYQSIAKYLFNPLYTTDDAMQQSFPFHAVYHPQIFQDDLITQAMKSYLAPIHYALNYAITYLTQDPIITGHWLMLIQLTLTLTFIFFAIKRLAALPAALFAVTWFLHTRFFIERMAGGLPRAWAPVIISGVLCFLFYKKHSLVLLMLLVGCLTNPPATILAALTYGLFLTWKYLDRKTRAEYKKPFFTLCALSPLYSLLTLYITNRSAEIGKLVNLEQASAMPAFSAAGGRFPFLPFPPILFEIKYYGMNIFLNRWHKAPSILQENILWICIILITTLIFLSLYKKTKTLPKELICLFIATSMIYLASRHLAFYLYVPNRHLQFPLGLFIIFTFSVLIWRVFKPSQTIFAYSALALLIFLCSSTGLQNVANFNVHKYDKGKLFDWLKENSKESALIAGHPDHIDGTQLFAMRKAYITYETAHPFYDKYYEEAERRLKITFKAYYAANLKEFYEILEPEKIDYFIIRRKDFYPHALKRASFFKPLDTYVNKLASREWQDYVYRKLPRKMDLKNYPFMVFRDKLSVVIDVKELESFIEK